MKPMGYGLEHMSNPSESVEDPKTRELAIKEWMRTLNAAEKAVVFEQIKRITADFLINPTAVIGAIEQFASLYQEQKTAREAQKAVSPSSHIDPGQFKRSLGEFNAIVAKYGHLEEKLDDGDTDSAVRKEGWDAKIYNERRGSSHGSRGRNNEPDHSDGSFLKNPDNLNPNMIEHPHHE